MPFLSVLVLNLFFKTALRKLAFWVCAALCLFQINVALFPGTCSLVRCSEFFDAFFKPDLLADKLTQAVLLLIGIVVFMALLVSRHFIKVERKEFNFVNFLLLILAGMNGIVLVKDVFSLYVFLEITSVASFVLIAFEKNMDSLEGAFKYLIMSALATILILVAVALFILISGSTQFGAINAALATSAQKHLVMLALVIFLGGVFIKSGIMPFHGWLPDAYSSAPCAVSVLLAGIVTKVVGVYVLMRVMITLVGFDNPIKYVLLFLAAFSIVLGAVLALAQKDFKRMLAYSSISQIGYIVLGLGVGTPLGVAGAIFHFFNHAIFKSLLFVNAAAVESQAETRQIDKMSGLAEKMPVTGITSVIASLSAGGIPPLAGFWSKLLIIIALWSAGLRTYAIIAVLASVITLAYFLTLQRNVFFGRLKDTLYHIREAGFWLILPSVILAGIILAAGLFFPLLVKFNSFIVPLQGI